MAAIQVVQVEDWPKFSGIWFLQVSPYVGYTIPCIFVSLVEKIAKRIWRKTDF